MSSKCENNCSWITNKTDLLRSRTNDCTYRLTLICQKAGGIIGRMEWETKKGARREKGMDRTALQELQERLAGCERVLVGLGEEWKLPEGESEEGKARARQLDRAYQALYELIRDKDYFIITMATDARIYQTPLGSERELVRSSEASSVEKRCGEGVDAEMQARMDRIFPPKQVQQESRWQRIVAPCGNETWRQCSRACTKDIWEPGEIPDDHCPHCGAPLTGNTIEAQPYIEEGYLPQWERYTHWLAGTLNRTTLILELGAGFGNPGVIRFPFEKTAFFNQKAFLYRINKRFPQITEELHDRAISISADSVLLFAEQLTM